MKKLLCFIGGAMLVSYAPAQTHSKNSYKNRKEQFYIGSYFNMKEPLGKVIYYKDSSISLQDFKGKIIILDLWHTGCTTCIEAFPKEVALQKKFSEQIQIIPVTYQSKEAVRDFLDKWQLRTGIHLNMPFLVEAEALEKAFRFRAQPHYIWIRPDGYIAGQTSGTFISEGGIKYFIAEWKKLQAYMYGTPVQTDEMPITNSK